MVTIDEDTFRRMHRWLLAQKLALASFFLLEKSASDDGESFDCARDHVGALLEAYGFPRVLNTLPPTTVNLLWKARLNLPWRFREPIQIAYQTLILGRENQAEGGPAPSLAEILASVILYGTGDARRVARLGQALFRKSNRCWWRSWRSGGEPKIRPWKLFLSSEEAERTGFSEVLAAIRDLNATSQQRLKAVAQFCEVIDGTPWCEQVENALFHQCFSWPLVVPEKGAGALALPILVDSHIPQEVRHLRDRDAVNPPDVRGHEGIIDITYGPSPTFYDWLRKASQAAHDLWRAQHGNTGSFRNLVADFTARFDFSFASDVVKDGLPGFDPEKDHRLPLIGGSASAYLAQVLLSRLLGRRGFMNTVITGEIGDKIEDYESGNRLLDYRFEEIGEVVKKVRYIFDSEFTDVIIVPKQNGEEIEAVLDMLTQPQVAGTTDADQEATELRQTQKEQIRQTAQVIYGCERLSDVANAAQSVGWRKTQYIRCPDVGYKVQGWKIARRENGSFELKSWHWKVLSVLEQSTEAVVELPGEIWPANVGQALEYINSHIREYDRTPEGKFVKAKKPAPSLSWAFIRMFDGEEDSEFWQIVWQVIGAPLEEFELFCCSPTAGIAAEQLISALNKFAPELDRRSHRAPDVIVLIGFHAVCKAFDESQNPASRPLAPGAVIREIRRRQNNLGCAPHRSQHRSPRVWEALKNVRILLVANNSENESQDEPRIEDMEEKTIAQLRSLAVFDESFTHHCAAMVLSEQFLFNAPFGPENELDAGQISNSLMNTFEDHKQQLPDDASVVVVEAGRQWQIKAESRQYVIKKSADSLDIYSGIRSGQVKEALRKLKYNGASTLPVLGEFGGEYFIPAALRKKLRDSDPSSPGVKAKRHRAAGRSLAPYTVRTSMPGIPLERALLPVNVVAARKHFQKALLLRQEATKGVLQSAARMGPQQTYQELREWKTFSEAGVKNDMQTTDRAALWPGQGLIHHLIERHRWDTSADAQYLVEQLIDGWRHHVSNAARIPPHPMLQLDAARALAEAELVYVKHDAEEVAEVCQRFEEALRACHEFPDTLMSANERRWNTLHVKCWYADFLRQQPSTIEFPRSADVLDVEVWAEWNFWSSSDGKGAVPAQWLERQGDDEASAMEASDRYLRGYRLHGDKWDQFRFKALGAAAVGKLSRPLILAEWLNCCEDPFGDIAAFSLCCSKGKRHSSKTIYKERLRLYWQEAANELRSAWEIRVPGFREALWAACKAQGLIMKHEKTFLFDVTNRGVGNWTNCLDSQRIPQGLREIFREHLLGLPKNVLISVVTPGHEWRVGHYVVQREADTVSVCGPWILLPRPPGWW